MGDIKSVDIDPEVVVGIIKIHTDQEEVVWEKEMDTSFKEVDIVAEVEILVADTMAKTLTEVEKDPFQDVSMMIIDLQNTKGNLIEFKLSMQNFSN